MVRSPAPLVRADLFAALSEVAQRRLGVPPGHFEVFMMGIRHVA